MSRWKSLTDAQWAKIEPMLPENKPHGGRPWRSHRQILNAILWVIRTGAPWRDVPRERFGPWSTIYTRFRRWRDSGLWHRLVMQLHQHLHVRQQLDWSLHMLDGTVVRAHQHAAGAGLAGLTPAQRAAQEKLGRSRGGLTTKPILRIDGHGRLRALHIVSGHQHESPHFETLMEQASMQGRTGRPRIRPERVVADKAYNASRIRTWCHRHHVRVTIPRRQNERRRGPFDKESYRKRNLVERKIGRFKEFRGLATRYDKTVASYEARWWLVELFLETA